MLGWICAAGFVGLALLVLWCCLRINPRRETCLHGHFPPEICKQCFPPVNKAPNLDFTISRCAARQYSDEMLCRLCNVRWDMNDYAPPACPLKLPRNKHDT